MTAMPWRPGRDLTPYVDLDAEVPEADPCTAGHLWTAGLVYVHPEDVAEVARVRPVTCQRCDRVYPAGGVDAVAALDGLGAVWSPDLDAYAAGDLDVTRVRCALCGQAPCQCPPFGTPEYLALVDRAHGRRPQ